MLRAPLPLIYLIAEVWATIALGSAIGAGRLLLWLLAAAMLGGLLIAFSGRRALRAARASMARGEQPAPVLFEALVTSFAGLLLIVPGVLTDVMALAILLSLPLLRRRIARLMAVRFATMRPDLRPPVTIEGEVVSRGPRALP